MNRDPTHDSPAAPVAQQPGFFAVFPSIMLPMFLAVMDQTIVATALPAIAASTGRVERVSWIVISYLVAATIAAPIYGRLGDSFGRRRLMFWALAVFIVASILCAIAPTIELLALARALQGFGGGGLMTLSQALVGETIPPRERARYQGYLAAIAVCANSFGPVVGGYVTEQFGWRSIFLIDTTIALIAVLLARRLPDRIPEESDWKPDPAGLILFTIFVVTNGRSRSIRAPCPRWAAFLPPRWSPSGCSSARKAGRPRRSFRWHCCASPRFGAATRSPPATARRSSRSSPSCRSISRWCAAHPRRRPASCSCRSPSASSPARC